MVDSAADSLLASPFTIGRNRGTAIRTKRTSPHIVEIESLCGLATAHSLAGAVIQGVDLRQAEVEWRHQDLRSTVFLGCHFRSLEEENTVRRQGASVFPRIEGLPYDPYRARLYDWHELMSGWTRSQGGESRDLEIYRHFESKGRHLADITEELAQRIHDHAIDDALHDYLDFSPEGLPRRAAVGIMGGHGEPRGSEEYRRVVSAARLLARSGFLVVTGGGPGVMEAGNLGAYLADREESELDAVVDRLAQAAGFNDRDFLALAAEELERYPEGRESLSIPTWFYGHEPSNPFASAIAKYFSNSIREDSLLAVCLYGIVFAPGSAGTIQEIFQDYGQNHYRTFGYQSPMVFLGSLKDRTQSRIYELVASLAAEAGHGHLLARTDSPTEVVRFVRDTPPSPGGR